MIKEVSGEIAEKKTDTIEVKRIADVGSFSLANPSFTRHSNGICYVVFIFDPAHLMQNTKRKLCASAHNGAPKWKFHFVSDEKLGIYKRKYPEI